MSFKQLALIGLFAAAGFACSAANSGTSSGAPVGADAGADGNTGGGGGGSGGGSASCSQTAACLGDCADNDEACGKVCENSASPRAVQLVSALADCANASGCTDSACIQNKCAPQLSACTADKPVDKPPPPPGPPGNLLAALVGKWSSVSSTSGETITFNGNGTYDSLLLYEPSGRCITTRRLAAFIDGIAVANGSTLTLTPTKGRTEFTNCSDTVTSKPSDPPVRTFTWSIEAGELVLLKADGTRDTYKPG